MASDMNLKCSKLVNITHALYASNTHVDITDLLHIHGVNVSTRLEL